MKTNKKLRLFGLLMALMAVGPLVGQDLKMNGFAGVDESVYFEYSSETPFKEVTLGSDEPGMTNENCVFFWRVVETPEDALFELINKNSNRPKLKVFMAGDYTVEATRVSQYGYQTEIVCITFASEIELISATSEYACWEDGDEVKASDFKLITSPPGFEYLVEVQEADRVIGDVGNWYGDEEIHFRIKNPQDNTYTDCDATAVIYVSTGDHIDLSNESYSNLSENIKGNDQLKKLKDVIFHSEKKVDKFKGIMDLVWEFTPSTAPVKPELKKEKNLDIVINTSCCETVDGSDRNPMGFLKITGNFDFYAGVVVNWPLFPPVPKFGLDLVGTAGVGVKAEGEWKVTNINYAHCNSVEVAFSAYGLINVEAVASALDPDVLSVRGGIYGTAEGASKWKIHPKAEFDFDGITLSAALKASVTYIGFNHELFNLSFGKYHLMDSKQIL